MGGAAVRAAAAPTVDAMSMNNENHAPEWELGDAITIRIDPDEPETDDDVAEEAESAD